MAEKLDLDALERRVAACDLAAVDAYDAIGSLIARIRELERASQTGSGEAQYVPCADECGNAVPVGGDRLCSACRCEVACEWRPIQTAPKDGSKVVLLRAGHRIADGYWLQAAYTGNGAWIWPYVHSEPRYWMPLPKEPDAARAAPSSAQPQPSERKRERGI